jgi:hypothetical protein
MLVINKSPYKVHTADSCVKERKAYGGAWLMMYIYALSVTWLICMLALTFSTLIERWVIMGANNDQHDKVIHIIVSNSRIPFSFIFFLSNW